MFIASLIVNNRSGLHARPASDLVECCMQYESDITILTDEDEINAKSIVSVLSGGIQQGSSVKLQVEGSDEVDAGRAIVELINNLVD